MATRKKNQPSVDRAIPVVLDRLRYGRWLCTETIRVKKHEFQGVMKFLESMSPADEQAKDDILLRINLQLESMQSEADDVAAAIRVLERIA